MVQAQDPGADSVEIAVPRLSRVAKPAPDGGPTTLGGFDRAGVLRAAAVLQLWPPSEDGTMLLHGVVDPDWSERGIGRALMAWQEGRGRQILAALPGAGPAKMMTYVPEVAAGRRRLLLAAGFSSCRSYYKTRRDLRAPIDESPLPEGFEWRCADQVQPEAVRVAHNAAAAGGWAPGPIFEALWQERWADYRPEWTSFVVVPDTEELVGYVLVMEREHTWAGMPRPEAVIHRVGVAPGYRGLGIGRALLARTLRLVGGDDQAPRFASAAVDPAMAQSGARMLEGFGFSPAARMLVYTLQL
jgi:GNAT superfamily N-acetyltransferase